MTKEETVLLKGVALLMMLGCHLGSGFGIRYDLGYFVIRGDVGIGLHVPYNTGVSSYYNIPDFWKSVDFHLAIGYPF